MSKVIVELSMSLDGFIARTDDDTQAVHGWFSSGDVEVKLPNDDMVFKVDPISAEVIRETFSLYGANVSGRNTFDLAHAWGGKDTYGLPSFIVAHSVPEEWSGPDSPFTFVTDGIESAIAQAKAAAGDRAVGVGTPSLAQQCLQLGLVDELHIHLVPVLLVEGIRLFENIDSHQIELEVTRVVEAPGVTHINYRIIK